MDDRYFHKAAPLDDDDPYERGFADRLYIPQETPPVYNNDAFSQPPERKRKKRRVWKTCLKIVLCLLLVVAVAVGALHFLAKMPRGSAQGHQKGSATILLVGTDQASGSTDTIMLLNLNRTEKRMSLMSIPRDTKVNSKYTPHKINGAYAANGQGEEGMDALMDYVSQCVGFRPDGYLLLNLDVFRELVDVLGGVRFYVPMDMDYDDPSQDLHIHLKEGMQRLDGEEAMGVVRFRSGYAEADIRRVRVQRDFFTAALHQWLSVKNVIHLPRVLSLLKKNCRTDLSLRNMLWLAETAVLCGTDDLYMTTVPFYLSDPYVIIDGSTDYLALLNAHFNPYDRDVTWEDLNLAR